LEVRTEDELANALARALRETDQFSILNVHLAPDDVSPALSRLARSLRERI
jgi:indolepyruvate decarboxylase